MRAARAWRLGQGLLVVSAAACSDPVRIIGPPALPAPELHVDEAPAPPDLGGTDSGWVFDEERIHSYALTLEPEAWAALKASALAEQYFPAELSVDGAKFGLVGLRYKGNHGSLSRCADTAGHLLCPKLSMKLKFNEYEGSQRFFGLKRLNFNSMWADTSELNERLAYSLFREMGVAAPRAVHAELRVNDEKLGVFALVEQIDGRFTDDRFERGDGNLYKEQWPNDENPEAINAALETNDEAPDPSAMIRFTKDLWSATPETLPGVLAAYMDIDQLMAYLAVDRVTTSWDGADGFYCRGRGCYNHNYYLYQHEGEAHFSLIPWDVDNTFRLVTPFERVPSPLMVPEVCSTRYPIFGRVVAMAPGCDPLFRALALSDRERYRAQVERLLAGPFDLARLDAWLDARVAQLAPHIAEDPNGPTVPAFLAAVEMLRGNLSGLAQKVLAECDGRELEHFALEPDAVNDFESATPLAVQLGAGRLMPLETPVIVTLGERGSLDGQRDLLVSFAFPETNDPEQRWARARLPFRAEAADLSSAQRVRLVVQADSARTLHVGIDSAVYSQPETRGSYGWDVAVAATRQEIELPLASAIYPVSLPAAPESFSDVLRNASALLLEPRAVEPGDRADLSTLAADRGFIRVDRIEFLP